MLMLVLLFSDCIRTPLAAPRACGLGCCFLQSVVCSEHSMPQPKYCVNGFGRLCNMLRKVCNDLHNCTNTAVYLKCFVEYAQYKDLCRSKPSCAFAWH